MNWTDSADVAAYQREYYRAHSTRPRMIAGSDRQTKLCPGCRLEKTRGEFTVRKSGERKGHLASYCKLCATKRFQSRRQAAIAVDPAKQHRIEKNSKLKKAYGITLEDYERLLESQHGKCAICETADPRSGGRRSYTRIDRPSFDVDHDHRTGRVRGLLCSRCNRLVGLAGDDPDRALQVASYLTKEKKN